MDVDTRRRGGQIQGNTGKAARHVPRVHDLLAGHLGAFPRRHQLACLPRYDLRPVNTHRHRRHEASSASTGRNTDTVYGRARLAASFNFTHVAGFSATAAHPCGVITPPAAGLWRSRADVEADGAAKGGPVRQMSSAWQV